MKVFFFSAGNGASLSVRGAQSVWFTLLGHAPCPCGHVWIAYIRLHWPAGDALTSNPTKSNIRRNIDVQFEAMGFWHAPLKFSHLFFGVVHLPHMLSKNKEFI
jgi:hypothetical protein